MCAGNYSYKNVLFVRELYIYIYVSCKLNILNLAALNALYLIFQVIFKYQVSYLVCSKLSTCGVLHLE